MRGRIRPSARRPRRAWRPTRTTLAEADLSALTDPGELDLIRRIAEWPRLVETAAAQHEPHRVTFYLYDLASVFNAHWNRGQDNPELRFVRADDRRIDARAAGAGDGGQSCYFGRSCYSGRGSDAGNVKQRPLGSRIGARQSTPQSSGAASGMRPIRDYPPDDYDAVA